MDPKISAVAEAILKPSNQSLIPPAGTLVLCLLTLGTMTVQSVFDGQHISQALGVEIPRLRSLTSVMSVADGQSIPTWLTLFTCVFPHGGWWHVLPNVTALWVFGTIAERLLGGWQFVLGYFAAGAIGAFCHALIPPHSAHPEGGASLAIAGILGLYAAIRWKNGSHTRSQRTLLNTLQVLPIVSVIAWLALRTIPPTPDLPCSAMYHFVPFLVMWVGASGYLAFRRVMENVPVGSD